MHSMGFSELSSFLFSIIKYLGVSQKTQTISGNGCLQESQLQKLQDSLRGPGKYSEEAAL